TATADSGVSENDLPGVGTLGSIGSGALERSNGGIADDLIEQIKPETAQRYTDIVPWLSS
ncbi:hypothetical protein, partial [Pseudomonas syringae group genomosp. 7]|uniref:hypothetical protein n=1 Tax=Pseudomonas syringae group genomosp. 7 TaxID=251699 RepID=UPI00376FD7CB